MPGVPGGGAEGVEGGGEGGEGGGDLPAFEEVDALLVEYQELGVFVETADAFRAKVCNPTPQNQNPWAPSRSEADECGSHAQHVNLRNV